MAIKIAFIGAGGIGFCRRLFRDILTVPELADTHFALHDISKPNLDMVAQLVRKDLKKNRRLAKHAKVTTTLDRRRALADADYVFNCSRIGGLEAFQTDIDIPLRYGIDQCVGDTLCAGGIMYGQRGVAAILQFCKDIRQVAKNGVLFMNYANPMAINTWAALEYGKVNTLGLCHGIERCWREISQALGESSAKDIDGICAGINHQAWFLRISLRGRPVTAEKLIKSFENHPLLSKTEKCRIDVLKRFGHFSTESNGHLSEYLPWYRKRRRGVRRWIDMDHWLSGQTGGYLRACVEMRQQFETDFIQQLEQEDPPISPKGRSIERGSYIIEALETGRRIRTYVNVRNNGTITNLPDDAIVEVPAFVDKMGVHVPKVGDLPLACAATCSASINVQRMAKEAAVHGDVTLLKQAMLHDPLTGAVCDPDEVWQMTDAMLVAQARWLPQYKHAIPAAKRRLADTKPLGTHSTRRTTRRKVKGIDELSKS